MWVRGDVADLASRLEQALADVDRAVAAGAGFIYVAPDYQPRP